ncbi:MAG: gas vesicle protein [Planctomycetota bacterium]|nr:gas vesicle protein [Planctomycetota bacterium]
MAIIQRGPAHSTNSTNIADLLERVLDKGVVIAGDIKVSLVDIELLSIQIRLVICSVDKAKEMGMDWWANHPVFSPQKQSAPLPSETESALARLEQKLQTIEQALSERSAPDTAARAAQPEAPAPMAPVVPEWARPRATT